MTTYLSFRTYGVRPITHRRAYHQAPGWLFLELGSWTLEVEYDENFWGRVLPRLKGQQS